MTMTADRVATIAAPRTRATPSLRQRLATSPLAAVARNRLAQFAAIGAVLFAIAPPPPSPNRVSIRGDRLGALRAAEAARHGGALAPDLAREVDHRAIEDEILYREGVRLGLDRNDGIVRQRVVQKVLFIAEELGGATRPAAEAELRAFFEANQARWSVPERFRFAHVFAHRSEDLAITDGAPPPGEPSPLPPEIEGSRAQIADRLGAAFANAVAAAPIGAWSEPVASAYGFHRVRVAQREPARPARLDEVRPAVIEAERVHRRQEAVARYLSAAFARYAVEIDGEPVRGLVPSRRVAFRMEASGEDE